MYSRHTVPISNITILLIIIIILQCAAAFFPRSEITVYYISSLLKNHHNICCVRTSLIRSGSQWNHLKALDGAVYRTHIYHHH